MQPENLGSTTWTFTAPSAPTRPGDQPATVTVKKGDKTWTVKGDDEKALKELPDDVRPFVAQMLHGNRAPRSPV